MMFPVRNVHFKLARSWKIIRQWKHLSRTSAAFQEENMRDQKIFRSPYGSFQLPGISFCEFIFPYFEKHGQKTFMIDGITGKSHTYHGCLWSTLKVAAALKKLGITKGDVVGLFCVNRPEFIIAWLAALSLGAVVTEINPTFTAAELRLQLDQTGAVILFVGSEVVEVARKAIKTLPSMKNSVVFGEADGFLSFAEMLKGENEPITSSGFVAVDPQNVAHIPYSSGTSGLPKGVMISHHGVIGSALSTSHEGVCLTEYGDTCLLLLPLFHIYAMFLTWCNIITGCTTITLPRFTPETLLATIQNYKTTCFPLVPPLVLFLTRNPIVEEYDLSSLKSVLCGAAPVATEHLEILIKQFKLEKLRQGYGMTEICPVTMAKRIKDPYDLNDCVGNPTSGVDVKILDPLSGNSLDVGQKGEICARSNFMMMGYLNNLEATRNTIDDEGWLHTGDIGYFSEEGNLYVVDRIKELIKYKGHQVAPAELEALLLNHSSVEDAAVIGVPDDTAGELPRAYVVLKKHSSDISEKDIQKFVSEQTSDEKHLRGGVVFTQEIPKSASGKILRKILRKNI